MVENLLTLMVVERSTKSQNAFKRFFSQLGLRVLVSSSPSRAIATFNASAVRVDGLIISALELGEEAVSAFNSLSDHQSFTAAPALLIVNGKNRAAMDGVRCDDHRKIIFTPIKLSTVVLTLSSVFGRDILNEMVAENSDSKKQSTDSTERFSSDFDDDMPMPD